MQTTLAAHLSPSSNGLVEKLGQDCQDYEQPTHHSYYGKPFGQVAYNVESLLWELHQLRADYLTRKTKEERAQINAERLVKTKAIVLNVAMVLQTGELDELLQENEEYGARLVSILLNRACTYAAWASFRTVRGEAGEDWHQLFLDLLAAAGNFVVNLPESDSFTRQDWAQYLGAIHEIAECLELWHQPNKKRDAKQILFLLNAMSPDCTTDFIFKAILRNAEPLKGVNEALADVIVGDISTEEAAGKIVGIYNEIDAAENGTRAPVDEEQQGEEKK